MNLEDVDRELDALAHAGSSNAERVDGGLSAVDALLAQLAEELTPPSDAQDRRAAAERALNAELGPTDTQDASVQPATIQDATVEPAPRHPDRSPPRAPSEPPAGPPIADERSIDALDDQAAEDDRPRDVESSLPPAPVAESHLAELFSDLDAEVAEVAELAELGSLFEGEAPSEDPLSLDLDELEGGLEADSTSIFTAADVAAIRRSSAPPAPTPAPYPSAVPPPPPPAAARSRSTTPPPPSPTPASEEELALDDFELLIDDEEANAPDSSSLDDVSAAEGAPPTSETEGDAALEGAAAPENEAALEGNAALDGNAAPDSEDESARGEEDKGFFKKLFR